MKNNPYVGPRPYEREEQRNFFGRNREARDLVALILSERVVLFYAPSGAGKTSLLNAQVIPSLEDEGFHVLPMVRVGSDLPPGIPAQEVQNIFVFSALMGLAGEAATQEIQNHTLSSFLQMIIPEQEEADAFLSTPPLLIFDQFEELFTTHHERWRDAEQFFDQVHEALEENPTLGVVFAMREDFVAELDPYAQQLPRRLRARFRMERFGPEGALQAIKEPAQNAGIRFESGVAERLVDDLRRIKVQHRQRSETDEEMVLGPHIEPVQLQVVCNRLWENLPEQEDLAIQWEEVEQYGDIDRALIDFYENSLRETMARTAISERPLRRWFNEQLITPLQTRGLVLRGQETTGGLPNTAIDILSQRHILRADVRAGARWYELAHDRLVDPILQSNQAWETARQTPLRLAAIAWRETENRALLYRDDALKQAMAWANRHPGDVEPYERAFLEASQTAESARLRNRRLRTTGGVIGIITLILVSLLAWLAGRSSLTAYSKEWGAKSQYWRAIDQGQSIVMAQEAIEKNDIGFLLRAAKPFLGKIDTTSAEIALREALLDFYPNQIFERIGNGESLNSLVYSPDGRYLYAGLSTGEFWIWDRSLQKTNYIPGLGAVRALAYSPLQKHLAVAGDDGTTGVIRIWDIAAQAWLKTLQVPMRGDSRDPIWAIAYSPDGRYLASGGDEGTVLRDESGTQNKGLLRIWDLSTDRAITLAGHSRRVTSVAFSRDERYLASASTDGTILLWQLTARPGGRLAPKIVMTLTEHTGQVLSVAFNPTNSLLASASEDKTIRLWQVPSSTITDRETPAIENPITSIATLVGHEREVTKVVFSKNGQFLLSGSRDATVRLWDVASRRNPNAILVLTGHTNVIQDVTFSPDGQFLTSGDGAGNVRIWDQTFLRDQQLSTLSGHRGKLRQITFSPDGTFLASGDTIGDVFVWSMRTGEVIYKIRPSTKDIWGVTYSPDGRLLITCAGDKIVKVWDSATGELIEELIAHTSDANRAAFSPYGDFLVTAGDDGRAILWDTETWEVIHELEGNGAFYDVAYSPNGRFIATGSTDTNVRLWEITPTKDGHLSISEPQILAGHTDDLFSVAFSPDSKLLVSGAWDRTIRFWNTRSKKSVGDPLEHPEYVYSAVFSPDGRYLATGARDKTVRIFNVQKAPRKEPVLIANLPAHSDIVWSVAFSPDGKYLASSSWDGNIRRYLVRFEDVWTLSEAYVP